MARILLDQQIQSDRRGYVSLARIDQQLQTITDENIELNFSQVRWFDANLCAVLGALIDHWRKKCNTITIAGLSGSLRTIFAKNGFLSIFGGEVIEDNNSTTVQYKKNPLSQADFSDYVMTDVLGKTDFPELSPLAKTYISNNICEIYANAEHSKCEYVFSCGQYYPQKNPPFLDFTIVDIGRTIPDNVRTYLLSPQILSEDAIRWALKKGNTTKDRTAGIPGGLGLDLIRKFIQLNQGQIQIVSGEGSYTYVGKQEFFHTLAVAFPGTIVNLRFNLSDCSRYIMQSESTEPIKF